MKLDAEIIGKEYKVDIGNKVLLSALGSGMNKNGVLTNEAGTWEGEVREIRDSTYYIYWTLVSGQHPGGLLVSGFQSKHTRDELKLA
tara:strand:+ start:2304 stop:2564 length:261 start_codon:yes stop_codon:yes gene_type:complete